MLLLLPFERFQVRDILLLKPGAAPKAHDLGNEFAREREANEVEKHERNAFFHPAAEPSPDFKC